MVVGNHHTIKNHRATGGDHRTAAGLTATRRNPVFQRQIAERDTGMP